MEDLSKKVGALVFRRGMWAGIIHGAATNTAYPLVARRFFFFFFFTANRPTASAPAPVLAYQSHTPFGVRRAGAIFDCSLILSPHVFFTAVA
jgi:hypothetical protein